MLGLLPYIKISPTSAVLFYTFHTTAFLIKKSWWKLLVNVLTPQELGVCGESNEINGEKKLFCVRLLRKILFALDKF